jgi:signal transduction histidine kinase
VVTSILSTAVFAYLFLPPIHSIRVPDSRELAAMGVFLVTAVVVGELAARSRRVALESARLSQEQSALRRVATLVAQSVPPSVVFEAVTREVGLLCGADLARMERFEPDGTVTGVAVWGRVPVELAVGTAFNLDGLSIARGVQQTGGPVRVDSFGDDSGAIAREARAVGIRSSVGCPIVVAGRLWGVIAASTKREEPFPAGTEAQIGGFTELVATAIANAQAREELRAIAEEQAALRRMATLVARGEPPEAVFAAVAQEVGRLLLVDFTFVSRYDPDGTVTNVGGWNRTGDPVEVGTRYSTGGQNVTTLVLETGRPARMDGDAKAFGAPAAAARGWGAHSAAGAPISVESRLWGLMTVASGGEEPLPLGTEARLADFAELVATAIANTQAREELRTLADEQAALRRVATLVAEAAAPLAVFAAVAEEVGRLLLADHTIMARYEADDTVTVVAAWSATGNTLPVGLRRPLLQASMSRLVRETGRPVRFDPYAGVAAAELEIGIRSAIGAPITVQGRLWGLMTVASTGEEPPPPPGTEARLADFTELVATAIANAQAQAELTASRARIVATADQTRRRIERDLHDGAQQRLVSLALQLRAAQAAVPPDLDNLGAELDGVAAGLNGALEELQELSRGIHPAILSEGGLGPALRTLARRSAVPVQLQVGMEGRLPERVEVAAYYVVAEALTNVAKHAGASVVQLEVDTEDGLLRLGVRDDGVGGADPARGSGLVGLKDRVEATGGTLRVDSRAGQGTSLLVELPIDAGQPPDST